MSDKDETQVRYMESVSNDGPSSSTAAAQHDESQSQTTWQCLCQNPKVILLTLYANLGALMIGYDNLTLAICLAMPSFQMMFGEVVEGHLVIAAYWQSLWNALFNVAILVGSVVAGFVQDRFGRRCVFGLAIVFAVAGTALNYTAATAGHFLAGKLVTGFSMGMVVSVAQTYVSEIAPTPLRGICLSMYAVFMNLGMLIAISATFRRIAIMDPIAFRLLFAAAWVFPGILLIGLPFIPESPYWLVLKGDTDKAGRMLRRLRPSTAAISEELAHMVALAEAEKALRAVSEQASYLDCFRGTDWRRTRINLLCNYMPQIVGATLAANAPYFLNQTGMESSKVTMLVQIGVSFGVASAILNLFLMGRFRLRPLIFFGVSLCVVLFTVMGIAGCFPGNTKALWTVGLSLQIVPWSYGPAVGATVAVASEISSVRLRAKTVALGQAFSSLASTVWLFVLPYLFTSTEANLGGKIGWIFAAMALIYLVWSYFEIPELKGMSFDEMDENFAKRVPTREFGKRACAGFADAKV